MGAIPDILNVLKETARHGQGHARDLRHDTSKDQWQPVCANLALGMWVT